MELNHHIFYISVVKNDLFNIITSKIAYLTINYGPKWHI
jgi:hypothetical protein